MNYFTNSLNLAKSIAKDNVREGNVVIDATMGNGKDTAFLSELVGETGFVYAFDIQAQAVQNTQELLDRTGYLNYKLICDGHENMDSYIDGQVDFIIFNLGYLPRSSHQITTRAETTLVAIGKAIKMLKKGGISVLVVYHGHEEGKRERLELESYLSGLNQKEFTVFKSEFINQINNPPLLIAIERKI